MSTINLISLKLSMRVEKIVVRVRNDTVIKHKKIDETNRDVICKKKRV